MLIGVTGFIGKVWLVNTADGFAGDWADLSADPAAEVESGATRFEKLVEDSPVFDPLYEALWRGLGAVSAGAG